MENKKMNDKPKYNSQIHHRRSIRLKGYDYSQAGLYFVTICTQDRIFRFGNIVNGEMFLNEFGQIAHNEWLKLPERFPNVEYDVFQIMPNHVHGIILLVDVGAGFTPAQNGDANINKNVQPQNVQPQNGQPQNVQPQNGQLQNVQPQGIAPTVGDIVGAYKSLVFNGCLEIYKSKNNIMGKLWQRNYYEHIIRDDQSYQTISNYIINNPAKWAADKFYSK
jgi:REP element-mobilizing transposase RayT